MAGPNVFLQKVFRSMFQAICSDTRLGLTVGSRVRVSLEGETEVG